MAGFPVGVAGQGTAGGFQVVRGLFTPLGGFGARAQSAVMPASAIGQRLAAAFSAGSGFRSAEVEFHGVFWHAWHASVSGSAAGCSVGASTW